MAVPAAHNVHMRHGRGGVASSSSSSSMLLLLLSLTIIVVTMAGYTLAEDSHYTAEQFNTVCYSDECRRFFPSGHCDLCCAPSGALEKPCKNQVYSCSDCDCRYPNMCKIGVSHCVPAPGQNKTSQHSFPITIPGRCCPVGFIGDECDQCAEGYYGPDCSPCPGGGLTPCSNHGVCDGSGTKNGTGVCKCEPHYHGENCTLCDMKDWDCPGGTLNTCNGHGSCICTGPMPVNTTCNCDSNFIGNDCSTCNPVYRTTLGGTLCGTCNIGFYGNSPKKGELPICFPSPVCGPNGVANGSGTNHGSYACLCSNGFTGPLCLQAPTNWLVVGIVLGVVGLCALTAAVWCLRQRMRDAAAQRQASQAKEALLAEEEAKKKARKEKKHKKKRKKKQKKQRKSRRRTKEQRRADADDPHGLLLSNAGPTGGGNGDGDGELDLGASVASEDSEDGARFGLEEHDNHGVAVTVGNGVV